MNTLISIVGGILVGSVLVAIAAPNVAEAAALRSAKISFERAEEIAIAHVGSGVVEDIERDDDRGRLVYEVDVVAKDGKEHELVIDANDGSIVKAEIDD
jgi:uncharacterized membrane protein YkoI